MSWLLVKEGAVSEVKRYGLGTVLRPLWLLMLLLFTFCFHFLGSTPRGYSSVLCVCFSLHLLLCFYSSLTEQHAPLALFWATILKARAFLMAERHRGALMLRPMSRSLFVLSLCRLVPLPYSRCYLMDVLWSCCRFPAGEGRRSPIRWMDWTLHAQL